MALARAPHKKVCAGVGCSRFFRGKRRFKAAKP
jgi:hypothetical protein